MELKYTLERDDEDRLLFCATLYSVPGDEEEPKVITGWSAPDLLTLHSLIQRYVSDQNETLATAKRKD